jgi:hypothetical protein
LIDAIVASPQRIRLVFYSAYPCQQRQGALIKYRAGHWVHHDAKAAVNRKLLRWLVEG